MTSALKEKATKLNSGNDFGDQRGDIDKLFDGATYIIRDFKVLNGEFGEYVMFKIEEDDDHYFSTGSTIIVGKLKHLEDSIETIKEEGLPVKFVEKTSKNKRTYKDIIFYPNEEEEVVELDDN
jgi:hypothetical protein